MFTGPFGILPMHAKPDDDIIPLEGARYFTAWDFPPEAVVALLVVGGLYLWGVWTFVDAGTLAGHADHLVRRSGARLDRGGDLDRSSASTTRSCSGRT